MTQDDEMLLCSLWPHHYINLLMCWGQIFIYYILIWYCFYWFVFFGDIFISSVSFSKHSASFSSGNNIWFGLLGKLKCFFLQTVWSFKIETTVDLFNLTQNIVGKVWMSKRHSANKQHVTGHGFVFDPLCCIGGNDSGYRKCWKFL